mgnify:CR=1 FL=1
MTISIYIECGWWIQKTGWSDQQYIFQRFSRIENDVHTLKGTGLGLPIVFSWIVGAFFAGALAYIIGKILK